MAAKIKSFIALGIVLMLAISIIVTIMDNEEKESKSWNEFILLYQSLDLPEKNLLDKAVIGDRTGKAFYIRYECEMNADFAAEVQKKLLKTDKIELVPNNEYEKWRTYRTPQGAEVSFSSHDDKLTVSVSADGY